MKLRKLRRHGLGVPPQRPVTKHTLALDELVGAAIQLGRVQSSCIAKKLPWAAYYAQLKVMKFKRSALEAQLRGDTHEEQ